MILRRLAVGLLVLILALGISGAVAQDEPLKVIATYSILGDIVQNIAGDNIELTVLVGANGDSHTYAPSPQDVTALAEADLLFENGLEFETWLDELYEASGSTAPRIVVSDGIEPLVFEEHDDAHEEVTDLSLWSGGWVSGWAFGVEAMQPAFDAILETTPELTQAGILDYYEAGNHSAFETFDIDGENITFAGADGSVTCAYAFVGSETVLAFPTETWSLFASEDAACAAYRNLLLMPPHASEPGSSPHFHFRYGSDSFDELIADASPWYPSLYPQGTTIEQIMGAWIASARAVGLYIASVQGIEVALTEEEQTAGETEEEHEHEEEAHAEEDHHDHEHGTFDPHIWHDPVNGIVIVEHVRDALIATDPANAAVYEANGAAYIAQLAALDEYIHKQVETIPATNRILITSHDTFGYFAAKYGFAEQNLLGSLSTEVADPSAGEMTELIDEIQTSGVPAIFAENISNPDLIETLADEAGVTVAPPLYTDALGQPGTPGEGYLSLLRYNVDTIVAALQ